MLLNSGGFIDFRIIRIDIIPACQLQSVDNPAAYYCLLPAMASTSIKLKFVAYGSTPKLQRDKFKVAAGLTVGDMCEKIRAALGLHSDALSLYIASAFIPPPDATIGDLYRLHGTGDRLIIYYATVPAWG